MNQGWIYKEQIAKFAVGQTVLQYYTKRYRHSTEAQWRARIESHQILLDEKPTTANTKLRFGQKLAYHRPPWQEPPVPLSWEIIYEDRDLLIIDKPSGLPVLPGGGFLEHTLLARLQKLYPQNTPIPIHRLGRGTSGLMLLARSKIAKSSLSKQIRNRTITKVYLGLARGIILEDKFSICDRIGKISHPVLGYIYGATPKGKEARSDCIVIQRNLDRTIVEVTILTGRPHQIRIHLAAAGHPLVNDPLYQIGGIPKNSNFEDAIVKVNLKGDRDKIVTPGDCGYFLHAYRLGFTHPTSGRQMSFTRTPPKELKVKAID